jgi:hypothetical protein
VQSLPLYVDGLGKDAPNRVKYAQPAVADGRARLILSLVAVLGAVLAVTGTVALGLLALAVGAVGAWVAHGRIVLADQARDRWGRQQICLACTHLWEA